MKHQASTQTSTSSQSDQCQPSEAVVAAIADAEDVTPLEVRPPLATAIDPDALDAIVDSLASGPEVPPARVEFPYSDYAVAVDEGGDVSVRALD